MGYVLKHVEHPVKVSIIPRGEAALGFSQQKPNHKLLMLEDEILCRISVLLGGRCAEKIMYDNISTGASDDIEKISKLIHNYTMRWGMNEVVGPLNPTIMGISDNISSDIMNQCKKIVDTVEKQTLKILTEYKNYIIEIGTSLLQNETILYDDIQKILPKNLENNKEIVI
jgi:ATP-dependent Zn protease